MSKRVIIGQRGADVGMWIAPPGKSAESTVFEELLIDTTRDNMEPIVRGLVTPAVLSYNSSLSSVPFPVSSSPIVWSVGYAVYTLDIPHGLGFIPFCNISIQSDDCGQPFPQVLVTSSMVRLYFQMSWPTIYNSAFLPPPRDGTGDVNFNIRLSYVLYRQPMP